MTISADANEQLAGCLNGIGETYRSVHLLISAK